MATRPPLVGIAPMRVPAGRGPRFLAARPTYVEALAAAGAAPLVLAATDPELAPAYVAGLDGLVLPGGDDLPPRLYGEEPGPHHSPLEDELAHVYLALARAALAARLPTLGICLGCQVMNVALGGTLVQHLEPRAPRAVAHRGRGGRDLRHAVEVAPGSLLFRAMGGASASVMSHHHQAVRRPGAGLRVVARSPDGVIEGIEHEEAPFFVGVQWHPERSLSEPSSARLLEAFVGVAAGRAAGREGGRRGARRVTAVDRRRVRP